MKLLHRLEKHLCQETLEVVPKEEIGKKIIMSFLDSLPLEGLKALVAFKKIDFRDRVLWEASREDNTLFELLCRLRKNNAVRFSCELLLETENTPLLKIDKNPQMDIKKSKLETVKNALQYAVLNARTEAEEAEFALLLIEVQTTIVEEDELEKRIAPFRSLPNCPFVYCDSSPKCEGKCRHDNTIKKE